MIEKLIYLLYLFLVSASSVFFAAISVEACSLTFPDAISSHSNGGLELEEKADIINGGDNSLQFGSVNQDGNDHCDGVACTTEVSNPASSLNPGSFKSTSSGNDLTIEEKGTGSIGGDGISEYRTITVDEKATFNVVSGVSEFRIDQLIIKEKAEWNVRAGVTYWIRELDFSGGKVNVNVSGSGTARIIVKEDLKIVSESDINKNTNDASQFFLFGYGQIELEEKVGFAGVVYAKEEVFVEEKVNFTGAITATDIEIEEKATVTFDATSVASLDTDGLCDDNPSCMLGHFSVSQPSYALACPSTRTAIQIEAICDDGSTIKQDYSGTIDLATNENGLSEFYEAASGGGQISSLIFDGTETGSQNVYLFHRNENSDLRVTVNDTSASVTNTAAVGTDVRSSGFSVTGANHFQCGGTNTLTVTAIGQTDNNSGSCSVLTGFSGTKAIKAWFTVNTDQSESPGVADIVSQPMVINGAPITASALPAGNNLSLDFTDGEASAVLAYQDVGEVLAVNLRHDQAPYDGSVMELGGNPELTGSVGPFIVYPERIAVTVNSADAACSPASATCSAFTEAGANFPMALEAQCTGGAVAPSYQGQIAVSHALQLPSGGQSGALGVTSASITGADNGAITVTNQSISEVGVFDLTVIPETYFGQTVTGSTAANVGRFYPADFNVSVDSDGTFTNACSGNFSYTGQSFGYLSTPQLRVVPVNTSGTPTQNYIGDFDRLGTVAINAPLQDTSQFGNDGSTLMQISAALSAGTFADDSANPWEKIYTLSASDTFVYDKDSNARIDEFSADIDLVIASVTDGDASASGLPTIEPVANQIRFGRLRLENTYGSELEYLMMPVKAEYWNGSRWLLNSADECTTLHAGATSLASYTDNLDAGETDAEVEGSSSGSATLVNGTSSALTLTAPGLNNEGSVVLAILAGQLDDWLEFDWDNDPGTDNTPSASAQFGHYRGHDRIIYWREVSN